MHLLLLLIIFVLAFTSNEHEATADASVDYFPPYSSIVVPVTKHTDASKPLYSVQIMTQWLSDYEQHMYTNFLIDIDAPFIWHDCIVQGNMNPGRCPANTVCTYPVSCDEDQCTNIRTTYSYEDPSCSPETNTTLPGVVCGCPVNVVNPVTGTCGQGLLSFEELYVNVSDGRNPLIGIYGFYPHGAACVPSSSLASFPANVSGVMAFSTSPYAAPSLLYQPLEKTLALCLPSNSSAQGVLFFGTGPYYLLPQTGVDLSSYLVYTPLLKHPDSFGYYIGVDSIVIKKRSIGIPANTTTKLSTTDPYTILRSDIYNSVVRRFLIVTKRIPPAKPVAPFGLCFSTKDGKKWTISTSNSIKQITKDVACLAFVDGGATSEPAVVIGTFQFEDNFLVFDLKKSTFGFSSSLLSKKTSCSNFNFTRTNTP
ncbi:aspartic peptidase A1 family [Artemisia annua]|uniref:Aspartic peptidase A1 family n=1 Tax=Artemisia annua TaxID=35608 RepID=A0A2U1PHL0_ARTAN|nr:aspartic peptidase A1 family [Artemisia annua]